jgi:hypothetical protein
VVQLQIEEIIAEGQKFLGNFFIHELLEVVYCVRVSAKVSCDID